MKQFITPVIVLSLLMASIDVYADDSAVASTQEAIYTAFSHPNESLRVSGSNDIYRDKISDLAVTFDEASVRDPIGLFGKSDFYLYDLDAWTMVSSGPVIGSYRSRMYSLFGTPFQDPALNVLTMRSEYERRHGGSAGGSRPSWSYTGWRF
jgi:hypothetical protein